MALYSIKQCPHCGSNHKGKPFAVYSDGYHCFSCGATKRENRDFSSCRESVSSEISMPEKTPLSLNLLKKLAEVHVHDDLINKYNIYQSPSGSLVMPIKVEGVVVRVNERWYSPRKDYAQGDFSIKPELGQSESSVVLVEDYLSWIRLGEITRTCCLFGTTINNESLTELVAKYDEIYVWLDNDYTKEHNSGQIAAKKIIKRIKNILHYRYSLSNKRVINICTKEDPKHYTDTQLKEILTNHGPRCHLHKELP